MSARDIEDRVRKAGELLRQGLDQDPTTMSESVIHACYYAMFHMAFAVLLARTGKAYFKHASVIGQFGALAKTLDDTARAAARDFNAAFDSRTLADYGVVRTELAAHARRVQHDAARFVPLCRRLLA